MIVAVKGTTEIINRCPCLIMEVNIVGYAERCPHTLCRNRDIARCFIQMVGGVGRIIVEHVCRIDSCPEVVQLGGILDNEGIHQYLETDFLVYSIMDGCHHIRQTWNLQCFGTSRNADRCAIGFPHHIMVRTTSCGEVVFHVGNRVLNIQEDRRCNRFGGCLILNPFHTGIHIRLIIIISIIS